MKTAVVTEPYKVEMQECEIPEIGEKDVLIKVVRAGICGSDLHLYKGTHAFRKPPAILGHEVSGEICKTGSGVTGLRIGDRVTVEPQVGCGICELCKEGHNNLCVNKQVPGTPQWTGTFAEYFAAPEQTVYKLSDTVDYNTGALVEPLAVAVQALNQCSGGAGSSLAILGCGTIGLLVLKAAKYKGFGKVYCTDTAPFNRGLALDLGADAAFDPVTCDAAKEIREAQGGAGVDVCIVTAGAPVIIDQASEAVKKRGEVVLVSMITKPVPVNTYSFVFKEQKLIGTMTYTSEAFKEAAELINNGLNVASVVTHVLPVEESGRGLSILDRKEENAGKILVHM